MAETMFVNLYGASTGTPREHAGEGMTCAITGPWGAGRCDRGRAASALTLILSAMRDRHDEREDPAGGCGTREQRHGRAATARIADPHLVEQHAGQRVELDVAERAAT